MFLDMHGGLEREKNARKTPTVHRFKHVGQRVFFFPGVLVAMVCEICHEQRGSVLGVRTAQNIAVSIEAEQVGHIPTDIGEVGDGAVVHEDVPAEDERVAVDLRHDATASRTDVRE